MSLFWQELLDQIDIDDDGKITVEDFRRLIDEMQMRSEDDGDDAPAEVPDNPAAGAVAERVVQRAEAAAGRDDVPNSAIINAARAVAQAARDPASAMIANAIAQGLARGAGGA